MASWTGSFGMTVTVSQATAGSKTTFGAFGPMFLFTSQVIGVTNPLALSVDTPGSLSLSVDTPGDLSLV